MAILKKNKIIVASVNPTKIKATLLGFQRMFSQYHFEGEGVNVGSGVSDQPMSDSETFEGAMNRAKNAQIESKDADFWVGIEGGLTYNISGKMEAFAWIIVLSKEYPAIIGKARTASFEIAPSIADLIHQGHELGHANDLVFGDHNSKQKNGATGLLTQNVINRVILYEHAVILAIIPFKNKDLYTKQKVFSSIREEEVLWQTPVLKIPVNKRIYLAIREPKHAEEQFTLIENNRAYLRKWLPWLDFNQTIGDSLANIEAGIRDYKVGRNLVLGIWFEEKLAGVISFNTISQMHLQASIGYWLGDAYQGKGIMTNACKALVDYGFEVLNLHRIEIRCAVENAKSRAIPERLGFREEGTLKDAEWLYDNFVDLVVYSRVKVR